MRRERDADLSAAEEAAISCTATTQPADDVACVYWSLRFTLAALPWRPSVCWTGMSRFELDQASAREDCGRRTRASL
ncbi:hypothetical protein EMIHUDRAFT_252604 [Emiliania huxleyi CCMP1516]|uniref:Uncharacterized protein n=2 Tax=Emiliania huxleyi TaxID=2903 RepID=A0A0D3KIL9_EMIH1|nr:hypothetical protein EMIHUDRAFT_252604 [Emiliania huxleyi CCMP1516]EOD35604.1 hypothetical protein EMIHUDRAFT_252604 [Emiliania huxleyi CCMP1516]|eukprot:XP_005788033.1 hypothetical protein EMIHUDRAFT_252604 [Emiliania huxleyi CCMP1516]